MHVVECELPSSERAGRDRSVKPIFTIHIACRWHVRDLTIVEIFFALFGHTPRWMKLV